MTMTMPNVGYAITHPDRTREDFSAYSTELLMHFYGMGAKFMLMDALGVKLSKSQIDIMDDARCAIAIVLERNKRSQDNAH